MSIPRLPVRMGLLMAVLIVSTATAQETDSKRSHVIIITADALRADKVGVNGNNQIRTPHIDALAQDGVNFARAYASLTTTTPSHASLLSSLYPHDHKAYSNTSRISSDILMLPEILKERGWHTAAIVNMPWLNSEVSNIPQGIEEFARCDHIRKADKTNAWVMKFLDSRKGKDKPFFLWIHYVDTHTPYYAPGEYNRMYYPKDRDPKAGKSGSLQKAWKYFPEHHQDNPYIEKWLRGITDADYVVATYDGSVSWLDKHVGQVTDRLKANGLWEDTVFVFTADHGESLGEHNLWFSHAGLFEVTARVPLIIRVPRGVKGRRVDTVVEQVDVMPTILTQLGIPVPEQARGQDLWALLEGGKLSGGAAYVLHAGRQLEALVTPRYKYIRHLKTRDFHPGYPMRKGKEELYDLEADPAEHKDLASKMPDLLKEMRELVKNMRAGKRKFTGTKAKIDDQTEEMLRSLGYTQ